MLLRNLYLSLDPYMRGRVNEGDGSYAAPYALCEPPGGGTVAEIASSDVDGFRSSDLVVANGVNAGTASMRSRPLSAWVLPIRCGIISAGTRARARNPTGTSSARRSLTECWADDRLQRIAYGR